MEENTPALPDLITSDFYQVSWTPGVKKRMVTGGVKNESVFFIIFGEFHFMLLDDLETDFRLEFELARPD